MIAFCSYVAPPDRFLTPSVCLRERKLEGESRRWAETSGLLLKVTASIKNNQYNPSELLSQQNESSRHAENTHTHTSTNFVSCSFIFNTHWHFQCLLEQGLCSEHFVVMHVQLIARLQRSIRKLGVIKRSQICKDGQHVGMGGHVSESYLLWCYVDYWSQESVGVLLMRSHDRIQSL